MALTLRTIVNNTALAGGMISNTTGASNGKLVHVLFKQHCLKQHSTTLWALYANTTGNSNVAIGFASLDANTTAEILP